MVIARILLLILVVLQFNANALNLNDFLPDFMTAGKKIESANANPEIAFSIPNSSQKRNASSNSSWYCDRLNDASCTNSKEASTKIVSRVVIESSNNGAIVNGGANQGANEQYFNRNSNNYDSNAIANFNITNSNQSTLQAYAPKLNNYSPEDTLKNTVAIPLKPSNNTSVNVGANQVQFNVSY